MSIDSRDSLHAHLQTAIELEHAALPPCLCEGLDRLVASEGEKGLFCGDPSRQVTDALYYGGAGRIIAVTDLASAHEALAEIVGQGEGLDHDSIYDGDQDKFHPERDQVGHYFRFQQLLLGRSFRHGDTPVPAPSGIAISVDWEAVTAMPENPRLADAAPGSEARAAMEAFNGSYCTVLQLLERTFDGVQSLLAIATGAMYGLKEQIIELIALGTGPSFEWVSPDQRHFPDTQVHVVRFGPYLVRGEVDVYDAAGQRRVSNGVCALCRCGGSRTKPFCDGTHARIGFDGVESADVEPIASRRRAYPTPRGAVVYDDRTRCAHFGQCTDRLPEAFGRDREPGHDGFVDPGGRRRVTSAPSSAAARPVP